MYDVLVAGGGLAGVASAVSAARAGVSVVLIEQLSYLGGLSTAGLVNPFMSWYTFGRKTQLVGGLFQEILNRLSRKNGILNNCFDPEAMKQILLDMCLEEGVDIKFQTFIIEACCNEHNDFRVKTVSKDGEIVCFARRVIDCTGDGDLAVSLGADYEIGDKNGNCQAVTLMFDVAGVDVEKALQRALDYPSEMSIQVGSKDDKASEIAKRVFSPAGYFDLVAKAKKEKGYDFPGDMLFFISRPEKGVVTFNQTHTIVKNPTSAEDVKIAKLECIRQMQEIISLCKEYIPGFENAYILRSADLLGIRESRRILGEYVFSSNDVKFSTKHNDAICRLAYPVDIHDTDGQGYTVESTKKMITKPADGDWYEIPFRCLKISGVKNALVAGRCLSATHEGQGAMRIMPACVATGEAAGSGAAISIKNNKDISDIDTNDLLMLLRKRGAIL